MSLEAASYYLAVRSTHKRCRCRRKAVKARSQQRKIGVASPVGIRLFSCVGSLPLVADMGQWSIVECVEQPLASLNHQQQTLKVLPTSLAVQLCSSVPRAPCATIQCRHFSSVNLHASLLIKAARLRIRSSSPCGPVRHAYLHDIPAGLMHNQHDPYFLPTEFS